MRLTGVFSNSAAPRRRVLCCTAVCAAALLGAGTPALAHKGHDHGQDQPATRALQANAAQAPKATPGKRRGSRWGADYFPNVVLTTHEGKQVRFFDDLIKDKVVMINLIYASCTDSCPMATAQLVKVQHLLGDRVGRDIFMYSITVDPSNDTPEVLNRHAEKYHVGPGWLFLTGSEQDVMLLRNKLGFHFMGMRDDLKDHSGAVLMGNQRTGQWLKRSPMDNPYILAEQAGTWLSNWSKPGKYSNNDYADAPELQIPTMGENLFRTRCTACHTIGGEQRTVGATAGAAPTGPGMGPDLLGVTRTRERTWLARWLSNPAAMVAAKDPLATRLYAEYGNVIMPNFHLSGIEVKALIEYLAVESRRVEEARVAGAAGGQ